MKRITTGLDVLAETPELIGGRAWALLANQATVTADLDPARAVLSMMDAGPLRCLFGPEHGLDGMAQDMEEVGDQTDELTGAPVRSLYGGGPETFAPAAADLEDLDVMVVDVPDIGARYYTFAATMDAVMGSCEASGVEVMVLDRPNPIGGVKREGGMVRPGFESFVSQLPTPVRHGLSLGELAMLLQRERYPELELTVVQCRGWRRDQWWEETGLPWVPPSPNMPTVETAVIYPGLCLVEATTLSEGRGTTRPFHLVGAPWVDGVALTAALRSQDLPGIGFRATRFRPEFGKHAGEVCSGIELHVVDRERLVPLALGLSLLQTIYRLHPEDFKWRSEPYEYVADIPALDLLTGSAVARSLVESGDDLGPLLDQWKAEVRDFDASLEGILLYHEVE